MLYYTINNRRNKHGNLLFDFINSLKESYFLYKHNKKWVTVIPEHTYKTIIKHIKILDKEVIYKRNLTRQRKCVNMVKAMECIDIPNDHITDKTMLVKREFGVWVDDPVISDISNSGFKEIYLSRIINSDKFLIELKVRTTKATNESIIYSKALCFSNDHNLKKILFNFIRLRCNIKNIPIPDINNIDFTLSYLLASKIGFHEDQNPIEAKEIMLSDVNHRFCKRVKDYTSDNNLINDLSNTGYKYINMWLDKDVLNVALTIKRKILKTFILTSNINKVSKNDLDNIYKEKLVELIKIRCQNDDTLSVPKIIDFNTGMEFINNKLLNNNTIKG